jgi:hypothetical protein
MRLGALVFHTDDDSLFQGFPGTTRFAGSQKLMAYFEKNFHICVPHLTVGYVFSLVGKLCQRLDCFLKKEFVLFATTQFPDESTGSIHENDSPS